MLKANRVKRQKRIRGKIRGESNSPRLSVFRSNKYIYAQAIDDTTGKTIASISDMDFKDASKKRQEKAKELGVLLAEKLKKLKIMKIAFDKGGFRYHGLVKSFAEGLREGGLKF